MAVSDVGQAAGTILLLALFVSGNFQIWHLYLVTFVQSTFGIFQRPAFDASTTMLVPDEQRDRANAIRQDDAPGGGYHRARDCGCRLCRFRCCWGDCN